MLRAPWSTGREREPPLARHPKFDTGYRAHNTNVYPRRPDRAYIGYLDGGAIVLDISDVRRLGVLTESVKGLNPAPLTIDHHLPDDEPPGTVFVTDTKACAGKADTATVRLGITAADLDWETPQ